MAVPTQRRYIAPRKTAWTDLIDLAQADPALGIGAITLSLRATMVSDVYVESSEQAASSFTSTDAASVVVQRPDGTAWLTARPSTLMATTLAAADGAADFAGASGRGRRGTTASAMADATYAAGGASADAALLTGTGMVALPVAATARVSAMGPGNMTALFRSMVGAVVSTRSDNAKATGGTITGGITTTNPTPVLPPSDIVRSAAQQRIIARQTTGWTVGLTLDGFDATLGQLYGVELQVEVDGQGTSAAENLDPAAAGVKIDQNATITLATLNGTTLAQAGAGLSTTRQLAAFDGVNDFAGASGASLAGAPRLFSSGTFKTTLTAATDTARFIGSSVILPVVSRGSTIVDGPGNLAMSTTLQAGATVTVTYLYRPGLAQAAPAIDPNLASFGETLSLGLSSPGMTAGLGGTLVAPQGVFGASVAVLSGGQAILRAGSHVLGHLAVGGTALGGGSLRAEAGSVIARGALSNGAVATIDGAAFNLAIGGALAVVRDGGRTAAAQITAGGTELVAGGWSQGARIAASGTQIVEANGTSVNATLVDGGSAVIESLGRAVGTSIGANGTLTVAFGGSATGVAFTGAGGTLVIRAGAQVSGIKGFVNGDTIDLRDIAFTPGLQATFQTVLGTAPGSPSITASIGTAVLTFLPGAGPFGSAGFSAGDLMLSADAAGTGTAVTLNPARAGGLEALFDSAFYLAQNSDVARAGINPLRHFQQSGRREGRAPSLVFSASAYLKDNPDVAAAGLDPLVHYQNYGRNEGRKVSLSGGTAVADALVQAAYYDPQLGATLIPTGKAAEQQAAYSYDKAGWRKGLDPNALFDTSDYLARNPDIAAAKINPLHHYENNGWKEGRDPSAQFSVRKYLDANLDVKTAGIDPLRHYLLYGRAEGRMAFLGYGAPATDRLIQAAYYGPQAGGIPGAAGVAAEQRAAYSYATGGWQKGLNPNPFFDTGYYLSHNPDVAAAMVNPLLHYEKTGWKEGRDPSALFSVKQYLAAYADVRNAKIDPLAHYVVSGANEGRTAFAV